MKNVWFFAAAVTFGIVSSAFGMNPTESCGDNLKNTSRLFLEAAPSPVPSEPGSAKYWLAAAAGNYTPLSNSQIFALEMKRSVETVTGTVSMQQAKGVLDAVRKKVPAPAIAVTVWADVAHRPDETVDVVPFTEYFLNNVDRISGRAKTITFGIPVESEPVDIYAFGRAFNANVAWELDPTVRKIRIVIQTKAPLERMTGMVEFIFERISQAHPSARATVVELIAVDENNPQQVGVLERRFGRFSVSE